MTGGGDGGVARGPIWAAVALLALPAARQRPPRHRRARRERGDGRAGAGGHRAEKVADDASGPGAAGELHRPRRQRGREPRGRPASRARAAAGAAAGFRRDVRAAEPDPDAVRRARALCERNRRGDREDAGDDRRRDQRPGPSGAGRHRPGRARPEAARRSSGGRPPESARRRAADRAKPMFSGWWPAAWPGSSRRAWPCRDHVSRSDGRHRRAPVASGTFAHHRRYAAGPHRASGRSARAAGCSIYPAAGPCPPARRPRASSHPRGRLNDLCGRGARPSPGT